MYRKLFPLLLTVLLIASCSRRAKKELPTSEGSPAEVLVVTHESLTENAESIFRQGFQYYDSILLIAEKAEQGKYEPSLSFWFARHQAHEGSEKNAPLILVFEPKSKEAGAFSDDLDEEKPSSENKGQGFSIQTFSNVWAKKQTVVRLKTDGETVPSSAWPEIEKIFRSAELKQGLTGNLAPTGYCDSIASLIQGQYGFRFDFPPQFRLEFSNREVVWLWQETNRFYRHVFMNIFSDSARIETLQDAVSNRNMFTDRYLKNDEGTRVKVSESALFPLTWQKQVSVGKMKADVLRGWYAEEGTYRRGPFVRYFFRDTENRRIIAMDGFLHAPDMPRLTFYRTFDLMAATFELK